MWKNCLIDKLVVWHLWTLFVDMIIAIMTLLCLSRLAITLDSKFASSLVLGLSLEEGHSSLDFRLKRALIMLMWHEIWLMGVCQWWGWDEADLLPAQPWQPWPCYIPPAPTPIPPPSQTNQSNTINPYPARSLHTFISGYVHFLHIYIL